MKKLFFFAAAMLTSLTMSAAVEYVANAGVGSTFDQKDEKGAYKTVAAAKGDVMAQGTNFTVKNAYDTKYKLVGMQTDTSYVAIQIGDQTISYLVEAAQGQDNPTAGGGNPVLDMKAPNAGSCYLLEPKKDGYMYVVVKTTMNKQQFVFMGVQENAGQVAGTMVGYEYLTMANPDKCAFGNPVNGAISVNFVGQGASNKLLAPCPMVNTAAGTSLNVSGVGVMVFPVKKDVKVLFGTAGSKMMACGFAFSEEKVEVKAIGTKGIKAAKPEWTGADNYDDVVISDPANYYVSRCDEQPILIRVKMPANEYKKSYTAADTTNIWAKVIDDGKGGYKLNGNIYAWTWGTYKDGTTESGKWLQAAKSGDYYVVQVDGMSTVNVVLNADGNWDGGDTHKTVNYEGITSDVCLQVGDVTPGQMCAVITLDCLTGEPLAINNVFENARIEKVIENGQLIIKVDGVRYNVQGARL